jgi:hypothetical protein
VKPDLLCERLLNLRMEWSPDAKTPSGLKRNVYRKALQ